MIEERSIYHNVDTIKTFPTKTNICQWGVGFGLYGQPNPTSFDFFFFFRNSNLLTTIYLLFIMISLKL
jgi:hypothetical protein